MKPATAKPTAAKPAPDESKIDTDMEDVDLSAAFAGARKEPERKVIARDDGLSTVTAAWPTLPAIVRGAILAMIDDATV